MLISLTWNFLMINTRHCRFFFFNSFHLFWGVSYLSIAIKFYFILVLFFVMFSSVLFHWESVWLSLSLSLLCLVIYTTWQGNNNLLDVTQKKKWKKSLARASLDYTCVSVPTQIKQWQKFSTSMILWSDDHLKWKSGLEAHKYDKVISTSYIDHGDRRKVLHQHVNCIRIAQNFFTLKVRIPPYV